MKKVLLSTALVAGIIGGVSADAGAARSGLAAVSQFVISDSHAQSRIGTCTYYANVNASGASRKIVYFNNVVRFNFGRLRNRVTSLRMTNGVANSTATVLYDRARQRNRLATIRIDRNRFGRINDRADSGICGASRNIRG